MNAKLDDIVSFLDKELKTAETPDYPQALNGLQVRNNGVVSHIAMAVDASEKAIAQAVSLGADLLIVHHGLFWSGLQSITGAMWRKIDMAIKNNLAIYSSHLPLDMHPIHGNNARLSFLAGMEVVGPGFPHQGSTLGVRTRFKGTLAELVERLHMATGHPVDSYMQRHPHESAGNILVCSGGAGDEIVKVAEMGVNTYITGEGSHWIIPAAAEMGLNLILAGHYATETFGVKSIGELLHNNYKVQASFIDLPPKAYSIA